MYLMSWLSDKNNCYLKEQCIRWMLGFFLSMSRYCLSCACSYCKYVRVVLICCSLYDFFQSNLSLKYTIKIFVKYTYLNTCSITSLLYLINQKPIKLLVVFNLALIYIWQLCQFSTHLHMITMSIYHSFTYDNYVKGCKQPT